MAFLDMVSAMGNELASLKGSDPFAGTARVFAESWQYRWVDAVDACVAIPEDGCDPRSEWGWSSENPARTIVRAGSDGEQVFPLGDDRWLAYGVYAPPEGLFGSNPITDFVFHVEGEQVILEDMVTWTQGHQTVTAHGFWLHDLAYGPEIAHVDAVEGLTVDTRGGIITGVSDSALGLTTRAEGLEVGDALLVSLEVVSDDAYSFDGAAEVLPEGELAVQMIGMWNGVWNGEGTENYRWNSMWPAYGDPGQPFALSFEQTMFMHRAIAEPLSYDIEGFGTLIIGNEALDLPPQCARRDSTEAVSWDSDRGAWTCMTPYEYDPHLGW